MKKGNFIAAFLFAAFAVFVIYESSPFPVGKRGVPGPGVFPTAVAVVMLMASLSLVITTLRMRAEDDKKLDLLKIDNIRVYISMAILVAYFFLVQFLGFFVTSTAMLFGFIQWFGKYNPFISAASAAAVAGITWYVFSEVLHVPFRFGVFF